MRLRRIGTAAGAIHDRPLQHRRWQIVLHEGGGPPNAAGERDEPRRVMHARRGSSCAVRLMVMVQREGKDRSATVIPSFHAYHLTFTGIPEYAMFHSQAAKSIGKPTQPWLPGVPNLLDQYTPWSAWPRSVKYMT